MRIQESTFGRSKPVLSRDYPLILQQLVRQYGVDPKEITTALGIAIDDNSRIKPVDFGRMIKQAVALTNEPNLGLYFGRNWNVATMGVFGQAVHSSPTLGDALVQLMKYYAFSGLSMRVDLSRVEDDYVVTLEFLYDDAEPEVLRFMTEAILSSSQMTIGVLLDRDHHSKAISFPYADDGQAQLYADFFGCPITFDRSICEVLIHRDTFDIPLPTANRSLRDFSQQYTDNLLIDVVRKMRSLPGCIKQLLQNTHGQFPTLEDMAGCLHLSPRTLCRRLSENDTSYQALLNEVRERRAIDYLVYRGWSVEKVASQLGFSDASNFRRAFKQWTGMTPGAMREQHAKEQAKKVALEGTVPASLAG